MDSIPLTQAVKLVDDFVQSNLSEKISQVERLAKGCSRDNCRSFLEKCGVKEELFGAAFGLKQISAQIHVVIHAVGILCLLPEILMDGEIIESVSLGAGNAGSNFDLQTNQRIAEFKFITWRDSGNAIRQNSLFQDFVKLAEWKAEPRKRKELYVVDSERPRTFLQGKSAIGKIPCRTAITEVVGRSPFVTVGDYFQYYENDVTIRDIREISPSLASQFDLFQRSTESL